MYRVYYHLNVTVIFRLVTELLAALNCWDCCKISSSVCDLSILSSKAVMLGRARRCLTFDRDGTFQAGSLCEGGRPWRFIPTCTCLLGHDCCDSRCSCGRIIVLHVEISDAWGTISVIFPPQRTESQTYQTWRHATRQTQSKQSDHIRPGRILVGS